MITTLYDIVKNLLGTYTPIYYVDPNTQTITSSVDMGYVCTAIIFIVCVWSVFRLIGAFLCSNR